MKSRGTAWRQGAADATNGQMTAAGQPSEVVAAPGAGARAQARRSQAASPLCTAGVAAGVVVLLLAASGIVLQVLNRHTPAPGVQAFRAQECVAAVAFGAGGLVLLRRRTAVRLGWTAIAIAATQGVAYLAAQYGIYGLGTRPGSVPGSAAAVWLSAWFGQIGYWLIPVTLLLLPDGRLRSPRWRPVALCALVAAATSAAGWATEPYLHLRPPIRFADLANPAGLPPAVADALLVGGGLLGLAVTVAALACLALRFRASAGVERLQLKWVLLAGGLTIALMLASLLAGSGLAGDMLLAVAFVPLPAGVAVAALRYRLWDVDLVVNRGLMYGMLTAATVAVYALTVLVLGGLLGKSLGAPLAATVLVALGAQPARARLQRLADRRLYGARGEPYAALARLGQVLEGAAGGPDLPTVTATIASTLRLPFVAVSVDGADVAAHGPPTSGIESFPLITGGERLGDLLVARRPGQAALSARDRRLLADLARQVAGAVQNARLAEDVQRSRERLVTAREEERRRIRRDLHDELGPQLAGTALQLDQARYLVASDSGQAVRLLEDQSARLRQMVADVRRLVHDLRPPALDELGLAGALRDQARLLAAGGLAIAVEVDGDLGPLSAAAEAAAYRIAAEAMSNAARHSGGRRCTVRLACPGRLELEVEDDGTGIAASAPRGIGLRSMRERAEELGGTVVIGVPPGGGTLVRASLPVTS